MQLSFDIIPYQLHFKQPAGTSRGVYHERTSWFVLLSSPEFPFRKGIGECAPLPDLSCDFSSDYEYHLTKACEQLVQNGFIDVETLRPFPSILFGLETAWHHLMTGSFALWDTPFSRGEKGIPINGLIWMGTKEQMFTQIEKKLEQGFRCVKLKIGAIEFDEEIMLLKYIRQRFSASEIELRLDANGAFSSKDALKKLERLAPFVIHSIEQPIQAGQWEIMNALIKASPIPIALDEELIGINTPEEKQQLLATIQPHYIILKPSLHGGFHGSTEWIELAKKHHIGWWITSALESNIGLNAIAQWCDFIGVTIPQGLGTGQLFTNNLPLPLMIQRDHLWFNKLTYHPDPFPTTTHFETQRDKQILLFEGIPYPKDLALKWASQQLKNPTISDWEHAFFSFLQTWWDDSPTMDVQTSGSTGTPKIITVEKDRMIQSAIMTCKFLGLNHGDKALLCLPVNYIAGKMMIVRALVAGLDLYSVEPSVHPLKKLPDMKFDFAAMIPMQVYHALKDPKEKLKLKSIRHCIIGGASVDATMEKELSSMPNAFYVTYGMTETLSHIAMRRLNGPKASAYYEPLPTITLSLSDEGTLIIHAPLVANQIIKTNDMAHLLDNGLFEITGRQDNIINSGGLKFQPEILEQKLHQKIPNELVITSIHDIVLGEKIVLLIENPEISDKQLDMNILKKQIQATLSKHERPKLVYFCNRIPRTPNGKIDRITTKKLVERSNPFSF